MRASVLDKLAHHPSCAKILEAYNLQLRANGKVNAKKFYEEVVSKEIPDYHLQTWYGFVRRFKTEAGLTPIVIDTNAVISADNAATELQKTLMSNSEATQKAIALALNISADALKNILENPEALSEKDRAELFLKVMKAQDSRVKSLGMIRADNREQERFERAFGAANFA